MTSNTSIYKLRNGAANIRIPGVAASLLIVAGIVTVLVITQSVEAALATFAAATFFTLLFIVPAFWLAILLIALIPFQSLLTASLGGFGASTRQLLASWKEVLLIVGIARAIRSNPNRRTIIASNRAVLVLAGWLVLMYCVSFVRFPSIPAVFSLDLETRFIGVMVFFIFLQLDKKRSRTLLSAMVFNVALLAIYGVVQYFWDYDRLLPLVYHIAELFADGTRRLYSYSLSPFDPAYGCIIAITIVCSLQWKWRVRGLLLTLFCSCLALTYTRSAYVGLVAGLTVWALVNGVRFRRVVPAVIIVSCFICGLLLFGNGTVYKSNVGQRISSIASQNDDSSMAHKQRMQKAVDLVSANPLGIGLGKYGAVEARFAGGVDEADYAENWILQVAVQNGVGGALAYVFLGAGIVIALLRARRNTTSKLPRIAIAAFSALAAASMMIPVWDFLIPSVYVWALIGMALATRSRSPGDVRVAIGSPR